MRTFLLACFVLTLTMTWAFAQPGGQREGRQGPPQEAIDACVGMNAGDAASFTSPRGDDVTGICEERDGQLILHPDNPPGRRQE